MRLTDPPDSRQTFGRPDNSSDTMDNFWIVIPAFNEGRVVGTVVGGLCTRYSNVVLVDDASADDTSEAALAAGAVVLRHPINLGQGAALQTGICYALERGADAVVTFDADGQHDPEDIARLVSTARTSGADCVLGSRFLGQTSSLPFSRRLLLKAAIVFTRLTAGLSLTDTHNGLRYLSRRAAQTIRIRQNRMAHASEILEQIGANRLRFIEAPVSVRYTDYSLAKGQRASGAFRIVADLIIARLGK